MNEGDDFLALLNQLERALGTEGELSGCWKELPKNSIHTAVDPP